MALCSDPSGEVLPDEFLPWSRLRSAVPDGASGDEDEARSLDREHGKCCFAKHDTPEELAPRCAITHVQATTTNRAKLYGR
jgi:hypothetical protein